MKKLITVLIIVGFTAISLFGADGRAIAKKLGLSASSKAIIQWERVFKKKRKMKRYGIDKLSPAEQKALKDYLISHAADSDAPEAAGM